MICLEVILNGEKVATAGIDGPGVLTSIVTWVNGSDPENQEIDLNLSGVDSLTKNKLKWLYRPLTCNDEVLIRIVDAEPDKPSQIIGTNAMDDMVLENKLKYYHQLKEELKDHL